MYNTRKWMGLEFELDTGLDSATETTKRSLSSPDRTLFQLMSNISNTYKKTHTDDNICISIIVCAARAMLFSSLLLLPYRHRPYCHLLTATCNTDDDDESHTDTDDDTNNSIIVMSNDYIFTRESSDTSIQHIHNNNNDTTTEEDVLYYHRKTQQQQQQQQCDDRRRRR